VDASLRDKVVLVHGATGNVGSALLAELARREARIAAVVRRPWQVARVEAALTEAGVPRSRHLVGVVDSEDSEAASGFVKGAEDSLGPVAALVSAAGAFAAALLGTESSALAGDLWRANFASVHTLARAVVLPMQRRRAGTLVFVGARAVLAPPRSGMALYRAAKAALHAYAECLDVELRVAGVRVRVFAPEIIDTPANREAMPSADRSTWLAPAAVANRLLDLAAHPEAVPGVVCE